LEEVQVMAQYSRSQNVQLLFLAGDLVASVELWGVVGCFIIGRR